MDIRIYIRKSTKKFPELFTSFCSIVKAKKVPAIVKANAPPRYCVYFARKYDFLIISNHLIGVYP